MADPNSRENSEGAREAPCAVLRALITALFGKSAPLIETRNLFLGGKHADRLVNMKAANSRRLHTM